MTEQEVLKGAKLVLEFTNQNSLVAFSCCLADF